MTHEACFSASSSSRLEEILSSATMAFEDGVSDVITYQSDYCPEALRKYYSLGTEKKGHRRKDGNTSNLIDMAKKHLSFMGWVFWYALKKEKRELRYCSPKGRVFYSLRTACKACMDDECGGAFDPPTSQILGSEKRRPPEPKSGGRKRRAGDCPTAARRAAKVQCSRPEENHHKIAEKGKKVSQKEDGGPLLQPQMKTGPAGVDGDDNGKTTDIIEINGDDICSFCHYGGDLVVCDHCPSSFHQTCLGLKELPEGEWFCPSCCCGICGQHKFNEYSEEDNFILSCHQCELQYHAGCLKERHHNLETNPDGTWFCTAQCEKIFLGFQKILGKPIPVGVHGLTWTLVKPTSERFDMDVSGIRASKEVFSKLHTALNIMHECFEPIKDPYTERDTVEDVIFCRSSGLRRLNFRGFYTVLLEQNDVLVTVATIRVHGGKVAEIPLVGTQLQYRRLGLCRILIQEIEKKLVELGVERLTLPAAPIVVDTWVNSFGFSKMTESDRLRFLDYSLLFFQDAIMCQKLLKKIPSTNSNQATGSWLMKDVEFNSYSPESEVLQAEPVEEAALVSEGKSSSTSGNDFDSSKTASPGTQLTDSEWRQCIDEDMLELLLKDDNYYYEYSLAGLLKDDDSDENSFEGFPKHGYHDECSLENFFEDDYHDENSSEDVLKDCDLDELVLAGFLNDDVNDETNRHEGDGY